MILKKVKVKFLGVFVTDHLEVRYREISIIPDNAMIKGSRSAPAQSERNTLYRTVSSNFEKSYYGKAWHDTRRLSAVFYSGS